MKHFPIKVPAETLNAVNHGPYVFKNVHSYQIMFKSDPDLVNSLVPEPLVANRSGNMVMVIAQYFGGVETPVELIPGYNEVVIGIPAKYTKPNGDTISGAYMVQLMLADREPQSACDPTILGLVVPGYPKRVCHWQEFIKENSRHLRIGRRGEDVMSLRIADTALVAMPMPAVKGASFLLKYIPSCVDDHCADVLKLNAVYGSTQITSFAQVGVTFDNNEIHLDSGVRIPVREISIATRCMMDMMPDRNEELINYLNGYVPTN